MKSPEAFCRIRGRLHCGEERIEIKSKEEEIINSTPSAESGPPHSVGTKETGMKATVVASSLGFERVEASRAFSLGRGNHIGSS